MQCWRCKAYGHRTGDRECPLYLSGNLQNEQFLRVMEDPMAGFLSSSSGSHQDRSSSASDSHNKKGKQHKDPEQRQLEKQKRKEKKLERYNNNDVVWQCKVDCEYGWLQGTSVASHIR